MTEEELKEFSNYSRIIKGSYEPEMYGFGSIFRQMGFYPSFLPFYITTQHGVSLWNHPQSHDLNSPYPIMFVFSKRWKYLWKQFSKKPCFIICNPYIFYRRKNAINIKKNASGTVYYFSHSTKEIDMVIDINNLIAKLKKLPKKFHPITICFHFIDITKKYHNLFIKAGFNCVTAGHCDDPLFINRFYDILSSHKFSMSNVIGSYTFYSIEMGIPFSLYGNRPIYINKADSSFPLGIWKRDNNGFSASIYNLFIDLNTSINDNQKNVVISELGIDDSISRLKFSILLYWSFLSYSLKKIRNLSIFHIIFNKFVKLIPEKLLINLYLTRYKLMQDNKILTHLTIREKILLHKTLKNIKEKIVCVEIGSFLGASTCFIANALRDGGKLYCIDTWGNHAMRYVKADKETERNTKPEFIKNTQCYKNKIIKIQAWSKDAIKKLKSLENNIDFLFLDGDHHYDPVKNDWILYSKLLKPGSIVAFHDTGWAKGVKKVIKQYVLPKAVLIAQEPNLQIYRIK